MIRIKVLAVLIVLLFAAGVTLHAQTTLSPGDVVVIGFSGDTSPGGLGIAKSMSFLPLVDLAEGTVIHFTDCGWLGAAFRTGEGSASYTVPAGGVAAGTRVTASGDSATAWSDNGPEWSSPVSGLSGAMNFSSSGDQVLVFQGDSASPSFVFAVHSASQTFTDPADVDTSNESAVPTGLATGATAVAVGAGPGDVDEYDNVWYSGSVTNGSREEILAAVVDAGNWTGDNSIYSPLSNDFAVTGGIVYPEPTNYPTVFLATPGTNAITLSWTDSAGGELPRRYLVRGRSSGMIPQPVDGITVASDSDLSDGEAELNVAYGVETVAFSGLSADTAYHFAIYPYNNSGTNIDYKTDGVAPSASARPLDEPAGPTEFEIEDFESGFGDWLAYSVSSAKDWAISSGGGAEGSSQFASINGYQQAETSDDWLISPPLDLTNVISAWIRFFTSMKYGDDSVVDYLKLKVSTDYPGGGDPSGSNWTELTFAKPAAEDSWTASGQVDLSAYLGQRVYVAFHYRSELNPRRWYVDQIAVEGTESDRPGTVIVVR